MSRRKGPWRLEVTWEDSAISRSGWTPIRSLLRRRRKLDSRCVSVGFVLADDKRGVVLAGSVERANATGVIVIPRSQILSRRRLR